MSDLQDFGYSVDSAARFNSKAADSTGWRDQIPAAAILEFRALGAPHDSFVFAEAVHDLQVELNRRRKGWGTNKRLKKLAVDGKLGRGTWRATLQVFDPVEHGDNYLVYNGRRLKLPEGRDYVTVNFDEPGGLDLHREADFQRGRSSKRPLRATGHHWAGGIFDPEHLFNVFENAEFNEAGVIIHDPRNVSSHGCISLGEDGVVYVHQWIDAHHRTWHGANNTDTTGWDWLIDPREKYLKKQQRRGWDVEMQTDLRGKPFVSMDPRFARGIRQFIDDHHAVCELGPVLIPLGHDGMQLEGEPFEGVIQPHDGVGNAKMKGISRALRAGSAPANCIGHHHYTRNKSDPRPYWPAVFPEFYASSCSA